MYREGRLFLLGVCSTTLGFEYLLDLFSYPTHKGWEAKRADPGHLEDAFNMMDLSLCSWEEQEWKLYVECVEAFFKTSH